MGGKERRPTPSLVSHAGVFRGARVSFWGGTKYEGQKSEY